MFIEKIVTATGLYEATGKAYNLKKSSMSLNKFRKNLSKATAVVAIVGIATCVFPAIAQAQVPRVFRISGFYVDADVDENIVRLFEVKTSDISVSTFLLFSTKDINSLESIGEFPGAIQDFEVDSNDGNLNLSFPSGTLRTSRLTIDPTTGNFPGLSFGYEAITDNNLPYAAFNNDGLRYDFTFDNRPETLTWFIPSNDSSLINSLSSFYNFLNSLETEVSFDEEGLLGVELLQGVVSYPNLGIEERFLVTGAQRVFTGAQTGIRTVSVPEPTATVSLFGVGTLGAVSLLKRNKRLRKFV